MNAKILKTRKALLDALTTLMETEPIEAISVTSLCECAGINRTTFYKYYSVPADVILEAMDEILQQTLQTENRQLHEYLLTACTAFYENRQLVTMYTRSVGNLFQMFYTVLMRHRGELAFLGNNENHFLAGGVASALAAWMVRGFQESPEEVAGKLEEYITKITGGK